MTKSQKDKEVKVSPLMPIRVKSRAFKFLLLLQRSTTVQRYDKIPTIYTSSTNHRTTEQ